MISQRIMATTLLALLAGTALAQTPAATPDTEAPSAVRANVEFGAQTTFLDSGERWSKFMEHRDIPKNFVLPHVDFNLGREGPWSFSGSADDATQTDARYALQLEKFGKMRLQFRYTSWPWFISRLVTAPFNEVAPNVFAVPNTLRNALEIATNAQVPALVNDLLSNTATEFSDLRVRRQRYWVGDEYRFGNRWSVFAAVTHDLRNGNKPRALGSYERVTNIAGLPGAQPGNVFNVLGNELPERLDYQTTEVRGGIGLQGKRGLLRVEYIGSFFRNQAPVLRWTNPFALTDQSATNAEPPAPPTAAPPNASGGFNRWRFSTGQLQLPPDNRAHTAAVTARIGLPASSFASAAFSYSKRLQDEQFLPITLNNAICGSTVPGQPVTTVSNNCPPLPAGLSPTSLAALPRQNLGGDVDVINGDLVVGTRRWKTVLLTGRYRNYRFDNNTPSLPLAGYAGYGEALWRSTIGGYAPSGAAFQFPLAELNHQLSYARQRASIEAVWKPTNEFQLKLAPAWEAWNRENREVNRTNEWGGQAQLIFGPANWFNARLDYRYGNREPQGRIPNELEFPGKWNFDTRHRIAHDAGIVLNLVSKGPWLVSARYQYLSNAFGLGFFGLNRYLQRSAGADVNYIFSDRLGLVAYYTHDRIGYRYRQNAKGGGATAFANFDPRNEWDRDTRDVTDSVGVGVNANAFAQKLEFSANYDVSLDRQRYITTNPSTPLATDIGSATARPWPDTSADYHELRLDTNYRIARNTRLGLRYIFQPFRLDDFAWDILQPYTLGIAAQPDTDVRRFTFLNARYASYDAHMLGFYLRYAF